MIKTAMLLPAGARVNPEEILIDNYQNIQDVVGGCFDVVSFNGEYAGERIALCGYVHDEGLLLGLEMNYLASLLFSRTIVGPCVVTYALSPNGEYDGDDYDMPPALVEFIRNDLLAATAIAYNEAALMAYASERMVADGTITQEDLEHATQQMDAVVNGEAEQLDLEAEMVMMMVHDYIERLEKTVTDRVKDAVKDVVKEIMGEEEQDNGSN